MASTEESLPETKPDVEVEEVKKVKEITVNGIQGDGNDEVEKLKKQLADTEEKLIKFKKFALTVRNERDQLNEKVCLILILFFISFI